MKYYRRILFVAALCAALIGCGGLGGDVSSGDRVLVAKNVYDTGVMDPQRYDVVVFKYPRGPMDKNTPKNYIKRLLGLPGELIAIFFGRLYRYVPPPGEAPPYNDVAADGVDPNRLWVREMMHEDDRVGKELFDAGKFEILRKPPDVVMALRRIVYDNDHQAKDLVGKLPARWDTTRAQGWTGGTGPVLTHPGTGGETVDWLRYQHYVRPTDGPLVGGDAQKPRLITDVMGYNSFQVAGFQDRTPQEHWAGDLMLEMTVDVKEAKGELWTELSRGIDRLQARWDLATGTCTVFRLRGVGEQVAREELATAPTKLSTPGSYTVRIANFDARLTVWVDRELPFKDGVDYSPAEARTAGEAVGEKELETRRGPTLNDLERPASVGSKGANVQVSHLRLWRNTYYSTSASTADYGFERLSPEVWTTPAEWGRFRQQKYKTVYVQPGHYLCLGDNSAASSDSRDWGLVPERLMLGRALVVYFPLHRMGPIH